MSKRKTHAEFIKEVADRPFDVLGAYVDARSKLRFRCHVDGYEWDAIPNNILNGKGCPVCGVVLTEAAKVKKPNKVVCRKNQWVLIDISTPAYPFAAIKIDDDDWDALRAEGRMTPTISGYATQGRDGANELVHRLIMQPQSWMEVDHINHDKSDNRRCNLRICTRSQNQMNKTRLLSNASGVTGVCWASRESKWSAQIVAGGKRYHLGYFFCFRKAVNARTTAEDKHFGRYSLRHSLNFMTSSFK